MEWNLGSDLFSRSPYAGCQSCGESAKRLAALMGLRKLEALRAAIEELRLAGYEFVTLREAASQFGAPS